MDCWELLGLPSGSDERGVRRRYAQMLKSHRPDDDPEAFQNLRSAYEQALRQARSGSMPEVASVSVMLEETQLAVETLVRPDWDFSGLQAQQLEQCLARAEAQDQRQLFETALLQHCLSSFMASRELLDWAIQQLRWFSLEQPTELPPPEMAALAGGLAREVLETLTRQLAEGRERDFAALLESTLSQPWLQAFDRRDNFLHGVMDKLLDAPGWSAGFFERICTICGWSDVQHAGESYQWRALVHEAEASAYAERLRELMRRNSPVDAEQKAAWVLLKPMPEWQRNKLMSRFGDEEWQACGRLSDTLEHRYPQLPERFGDPDLHSWREHPSNLSGAGWAYLKPLVWLLLALSMLPSALDKYELSKELFLGCSAATLLYIGAALLMRGWLRLMRELDGFDYWLSRLVLPDLLHREGRGLLLLRHLLPAACLSFVLPLWQGLGLSEKGLAASLLLFIGCGYYLNLATAGVSLPGLLVARLRGRLGKILIVFMVIAAMALFVSQRWQSMPERGSLETLLPKKAL